MIEIERKFLVKGDFYPYVVNKEKIVQSYLLINPEQTIRVRIKGENAFLTIKFICINKKNSNFEYEYSIPIQDAEELFKFCLPDKIEKDRYTVPFKNHNFEIDVFHGKNEGLVIAELELKSEKDFVEYPVWIGREVTGESLYYNINLI